MIKFSLHRIFWEKVVNYRPHSLNWDIHILRHCDSIPENAQKPQNKHGTSSLRANFNEKVLEKTAPLKSCPLPLSFLVFSHLSLGKGLKGMHIERSAGDWNSFRCGFNHDPTLANGSWFNCAYLAAPADKKKI